MEEGSGGGESGGPVLGDTSWRGERGAVRGEGKGVKKKSHPGWISRQHKLSERRAEV